MSALIQMERSLISVGAQAPPKLTQPIIALCIKQSVFIKIFLWETVVYIGCENKIVFVP